MTVDAAKRTAFAIRQPGRRVPARERRRRARVVVAPDPGVQRTPRRSRDKRCRSRRPAPGGPSRPSPRRRARRPHSAGERVAKIPRGGDVPRPQAALGYSCRAAPNHERRHADRTARRVDLARQPPRPGGRGVRAARRGLGLLRALGPGGRRPRSVQLPRLPGGEHAHAPAGDRHREHLRARRDDHARHPEDAGGALGRAPRARARRLARAPGHPRARARLREAGRDHARLPRGDGEGALHGPAARAGRPDRAGRAAARRCWRSRREKARGAHPYFVPPEHTARAREILGRGPWLCPEQMVLLETSASKARDDRAAQTWRSTSGSRTTRTTCASSASATPTSRTAAATGWSTRSSPGATKRRSRRASRRTTTRAPITSASSPSGRTASRARTCARSRRSRRARS